MDWYEATAEYDERTWPHDGRLSSLEAEWQRELVALRLVNRDVNNGGCLQFLVNYSRETCQYAIQALRAVGARQMAGLIATAQALVDEHYSSEGGYGPELFPNEIIGPEGTVKGPGSVLPDEVLDRLSELSYEFMGYPEAVGDLAQAHYGPLIARDTRA